MILNKCLNPTRYFYAEIQSLTNTSHKLQCTNCNTPLEGNDVVNSIFCLDPECHGQGKYIIRSGWKLHLYISQLPCKLSDAFISFCSCINTELPLFGASLSLLSCRRGCLYLFTVVSFATYVLKRRGFAIVEE